MKRKYCEPFTTNKLEDCAGPAKNQCCDLKTKVLRLECTRVIFSQVSVLVSRPKPKGLGLGLEISKKVFTTTLQKTKRTSKLKASHSRKCARHYREKHNSDPVWAQQLAIRQHE